MDKLLITGPCALSGRIRVSQSKNAYLPLLAAVLLSDRPVHFHNLPELNDIRTMLKLLRNLGVQVLEEGEVTTLVAAQLTSWEATYDLVKTMRASILVLGPLLARFRKGTVSLPGGCAIGTRPIDLHLQNLELLGTKIDLRSGHVYAETEGLQGNHLKLNFPSVGATENLLMAAAGASGKTIIENAALEPEIDDLAHFLQALGVEIEGIGTACLTIYGRDLTRPGNFKEVHYQAISDRIEAATYVMAALATKSHLVVENCNPTHLTCVIDALRQMNAQLEVRAQEIEVLPSALRGISLETAPYPGFPTDLQAQLTALALTAEGISVIQESIFENRFMHVAELRRLGANIELKGNIAIIHGPGTLNAAPVMCTDLRASAALVIAALAANGTTEIQRIYHLDRGYEHLAQKLAAVGAHIERVPGPAI